MDSIIFWCSPAHTTDEENIISIQKISPKVFKVRDCFLSILHKNWFIRWEMLYITWELHVMRTIVFYNFYYNF